METNVNDFRKPNQYVDKEREIADRSRPVETQDGVSTAMDVEQYQDKRKKIFLTEEAESLVQSRLGKKDITNIKFLGSKLDLTAGERGVLSGIINVDAEFVMSRATKQGSFVVKVAEDKISLENADFDKQVDDAKDIHVVFVDDPIEQAIDEAAEAYAKDGSKKEAGITDFDSKDEFSSVPVGTAPQSFEKQKSLCPNFYNIGTEVNLEGLNYKVTAEDTNKSYWIFSLQK